MHRLTLLLLAIGLVRLQRDTRLEHCQVTRDVQKLLDYYLAELAPDEAEPMRKALHARALDKGKKGRSGNKLHDRKHFRPRRRRRSRSKGGKKE